MLTTDRLTLRTWNSEDFEPFAEMMGDSRVMQFIAGDGKPLSRFGAWTAFAAMIGHWTLRGFGMFAVVERGTGTVVGRVGPFQPETWPEFEIGWTLRSEYWGKGYAVEAARRCIEHAFTELDRRHVVSLILPDNLQSIRVAERLGERPETEICLPLVVVPPRDTGQVLPKSVRKSRVTARVCSVTNVRNRSRATAPAVN